MKRAIVIILFFTCATGSLCAQKFYAQAAIEPVRTDSFYQIVITPLIAQYLNSSLQNLRLIDAHNNEVPFVWQQQHGGYSKEVFKDYEIIDKKQVPGCCTSLILRARVASPINNISLIIRNAEVRKRATLSGSDDQKQWFVIHDKFTLQPVNNTNGTAEVKPIDFPLSDYQYYKLDISDSSSAPLNIVRAGYYDVLSSAAAYTALPDNYWTVKDSVADKKTFVHAVFKAPQLVDKIVLTMTGVPYFKRSGSLLEKQLVRRKKRTEVSYSPFQSFEVVSSQPATITLPALRTRDLLFQIDNGDNPALQIKSLQIYQLNRNLAAWLKQGEQYMLKFSTTDLAIPEYDLAAFEDRIPKALPPVAVQKVVTLNNKVAPEKSFTFFTSKLFIWVAIVAIIGVLGFTSVRMVRETNQKK